MLSGSTGTLACAASSLPEPLGAARAYSYSSPRFAEATSLSAASSPRVQKLRRATSEFESLLLTNLWKSMKSTFASPEGEDDDSTDPAHDSLDDWGLRSMAQAVANAGGFGIGRLLFNHLEPLVSAAEPSAPPISFPKTGIPPSPP